MSEPTPPTPAMPAPQPFMARLDPPPDVQAAVAAALHACHAWQPVPAPPPVPAGTPASFPSVVSTVEAGVCDLIDDWPHAAEGTAMSVLGTGVALGLAAAVVLLVLRRGVRAFWRSRLGWWLRDTLGEPWRDVQAAGLGTLGGAIAALVLADGLRRLGLDGLAALGWLLPIGGVAGAVCGVLVRRSQVWRDGVGGLR